MPSLPRRLALITTSLLMPCVVASPLFAEETVSFSRDIRPLLSDHCFSCHGPDAEHRQADLRLDRAEDVLDSGVLDLDAPKDSELWVRITTRDPDLVMPPPDAGKQLSESDRELIGQWLESGANVERHWSFVAPTPVDVPDLGYKNPIDNFVQRRLKADGFSLSSTADRATLIRRVTLDLTGLPPTPAEVEHFLSNESPQAYRELIDNLMSRVTYGEHMARYWLDLARYADTHGLHLDNERTMWPYRDWVIRAFHQNLSYDEFTRWQLAGDLLDEPSQDQLIASGFNRCNVTTSEGGSINEEWIYRYAVDRTTTAVEVWMGLTAGCAVCHDHKFDPISTRDYYSMYAFFHSAADPAMDGNKRDTPPILKLFRDEDHARLAELDQEFEKLDDRIREGLAALQYVDPATQDPPPEKRIHRQVWFEDAFPEGAELGAAGGPLKIIDREQGPVFSGERALQRTAAALAQDYYQQGASPLLVPDKGKVFVHCYLDEENPPQTIMIQFHSDGWKHRAVWGDEAKIGFGRAGTSEKVLMGELPELGKWVRLEVDAKRMGLNAGTKVTGFAFTQFAGKVTWDQLGIRAEVDPRTDPSWSFQVWTEQHVGQENKALPGELRKVLKSGPVSEWSDEDLQRVRAYWLGNLYAGITPDIGELQAKKKSIVAEKAKVNENVPFTFVMADLPKPRQSFVMLRGAYDRPGDPVRRDVPGFLPALPERPKDRDYNRLDLANWLIDEQHPLTARVAVNRFWQQVFGTGLVKTSGDFGSQGEPPSHPELLDWLAHYFIESGWDVKQLMQLLLTSETYRQQSVVPPKLLEVDPENRLLGRGPRLRLDAEVLRDQVLYVSGLLVDRVGGKGVNPYQPPNIWEPVGFGGSNTRFYRQGTGEDLYRRSLYTFLKRTAPPPFMSTFDAPNREQSCARRERTNTPMQALQLMNDVQHFEAARHFAGRMLRHGKEEKERVRWGWFAVTGRSPSPSELKIVRETLGAHLRRYAADPAAAEKVVRYGDSQPDESVDAGVLAAYTMVANLLFNLDETVTKN